MKPILAAAAAFIAVPALADPATPFSGPFVGIQGGWQQDRQHVSIFDGEGGFASGSARDSGFAYGGQAGFDMHLAPRIVGGVEASITGRTGAERFDLGGGDSVRLKSDRTINGTARLGYLVTPRGLLYARGGYTNGRFSLSDTFGDRASRTRGGYTVGGGYEQFLTRSVSARIEYNYSDFGRLRLDDVSGDGFNQGVRGKQTRNAVTAGLNLHF